MAKGLSGDLEDKILTLTFRRRLKSHFGEVVATFSSIVLLYPSLSGSRRFPGSEVLWWICIILGVLGVILSLIHTLRVRPTREELLREADRLGEQQEQWEGELRDALNVVAQRLFDETVSKANANASEARLTVYFHRENSFVSVCRRSGNPNLSSIGRGKYPDNQGVISKVWQMGRHVEVDLPSDVEEWVQSCVDHGVDEVEVRGVVARMQSLSFVGKWIGSRGSPVGVVLFESLKSRGFNNKTVEYFDDEGIRLLLDVLSEILIVVRGSLSSELEHIPANRT